MPKHVQCELCERHVCDAYCRGRKRFDICWLERGLHGDGNVHSFDDRSKISDGYIQRDHQLHIDGDGRRNGHRNCNEPGRPQPGD